MATTQSIEMEKSEKYKSKIKVLGGLQNVADNVSREVLRAYSPDLDYEDNLANVQQKNADKLEALGKFLGFPDLRSASDKKLYPTKKDLCDRLILRIESLFIIHCDECNNDYQSFWILRGELF